MKVLSTDGLTKLIQLIKSAFISVDDTVSTSTVTLATVATSGSYNDLSNKPTIPDTSNLANKDLSNLSNTGNTKFQVPLVSGTNIKTINNNSILGSGNLTLDGLPSQTGKAGKFLQTDGTDASWQGAPGRNIGEIVTSTIPLTDAGLHLLDGSLIQGDGIYSAFVDYIAELYTESSKKSNVTKVGSLTDNNGVLSGFSTSNYARLPVFSPNSNTWEIVLKVKFNSLPGNQDFLSGQNNPIIAFFVKPEGKLYFNIGDGSSWVTGDIGGTTTLSTNTFYYIKLIFNGTQYISYSSADGITWVQEATCTGNVNISNATLNLGVNRSIMFAIDGSIDLNESFININGQRWWTGMQTVSFTDEVNWQQSVSDCGSCGKFVYDAVNNTVRLPKISCLAESTTNAEELGNINSYSYSTGSSKIYSAKSFYYITVATSSKTDVQIDIDQVTTDLNGKADVDLSNTTDTGHIKMAKASMPSNKYINLTLNASGSSYIAPADGYVVLEKINGTNASRLAELSTDGIATISFAPYSVNPSKVFLPVKKGEAFVAWYDSSGEVRKFRFVYAEGSESEAN